MVIFKKLFFLLFFFPALVQAQDECSTRLIFASDTQEPMKVETIYLKSSNNVVATAKLFQDMIDQKPSEIFLLGDVVNVGYQESRWTLIDSALKLAEEKNIPVNAILGNHELIRNKTDGEKRFQDRFPMHIKTGYYIIRDSLAVVLLNSNFKKLTKKEVARQQEWYLTALDSLDANPKVKAIIVCCHHSPYSNSKLVGSSVPVQKNFVNAFMKSPKSKIFISGHAHAFQHFRIKEKDFFVIGGGGGLHHPLKRKKGQISDLEPDYDPLFHYLIIEQCGGIVKICSRRLLENFTGFEDGCIYYF
jgi:hypothetical protein